MRTLSLGTAAGRSVRAASRNRSDEERAAMLLATAVGVGLLFAASLTLFGGPLANSLKDLAPPTAASADTQDR